MSLETKEELERKSQ